ncbi:MAG: glycosyltransferase family 4 protein [Thermoanaerobaculia bacterium]
MNGVRLAVAVVDPGAFSPFYDDALCRALAREGCEVELVTAPFAYHPWPAAEGYRRRELFPRARAVRPSGGAGAGWLRRRLARFGRGLAYLASWRSFEAALEEQSAALVHLQWSLVPHWEAYRFARGGAAHLPLVVTVHNAGPRSDDPQPLGGGERLLRRARAVVVHSENTREAVAARHPSLASRILVVPPGIAGPSNRELEGEAGRRRARQALGIPMETPLALFAGLVRASKGLDPLLAAFRDVAARRPEAMLAIAGLPHASAGDLAARVDRSGLAGRVRLDPAYLPLERFEQYIAAADVVVLPYLEGSDSAVLGAALGAGRAVVVTRVGGLPEMLGPTYPQELIVAPGDPAALAAAIDGLLGDRPTAARIGVDAGADAMRRLSWKTTARATADIYRELTRDRARRHSPVPVTRPA